MAGRTAVVAGTATAVAGRTSRRQQQKYASQDAAAAQQAAPQQMEAAPPPPPAEDPYDQIAKLSKLHDSGALTDEEFAAEKAKILGT